MEHALPFRIEARDRPILVVSPTDAQHRSEPALRAAVARLLRANGLAIEELVPCAAGELDIATASRDTIVEIKHRLTRKALFQAVGQISSYRQAINPDARAIIVGYATNETAALLPYITPLGIEIVCWQDQPEDAEWRIDPEEIAPLPTSDHRSHPPITSVLRWVVKERALVCGFASVRELSFAARVPRQSLHPIWMGVSKNVSLDMLGILAKTLDANLGEWFRWDGEILRWRIQEATEAKGFTLSDLSWAAAILPQGLGSMWHDTQKFVFVETLARLARALDLDVGDLFTWQTPLQDG
jgi:DNA-binding Xre family transcriptional regulator